MKKKNGFTLVELLAVIVVLAIIMIVAVPSVLNALDTAKKKSFALYAENAIRKTIELAQNDELKGTANYSAITGLDSSGAETTRNRCYSLESTKLETSGKYHGSIWYDTDSKGFYVYLTDGVYYTEIDSEYYGLTLSDLNNLDTIHLVADFSSENNNGESANNYFNETNGRFVRCGLGKIKLPVTTSSKFTIDRCKLNPAACAGLHDNVKQR